MSSPITFGGFNNIDFNAVLNLMMQQATVPRTLLASQQTNLQNHSSIFTTLASRLSALSSAAAALNDPKAASGRATTSTDDSVVSSSSDATAVMGTYDVVVSHLAQSQVTTSSSLLDDTDQTVVANGGSLVIGGVTVDLSGQSVTLQGLADAINATDKIGVTATVVSPTSGKYELVLTGNNTGAANAFSITNDLTLGGAQPLVTFAGNTRSAADAELTVNDVAIRNASNVVTGAIPGTTLTLHRKSTVDVSISVTQDTSTATSTVMNFVGAYNDLSTFVQAQGNDSSGIGQDPLLKTMWAQLRSTIGARYAAGGTQPALAAIGVGFDKTGKLTVDSAVLSDALTNHEADVNRLFAGDGVNSGVFSTLGSFIDSYVKDGGLLAGNQQRITDQVARMSDQLAAMDDRLAIQKQSLQQQFTATDALMTQLTSQAGTLTNLNSGYRLF